MLMYNLIEYNYSETSAALYQFCRDEPKNYIVDSGSLEFKLRFF